MARILVADDEIMVRQLIRIACQIAGHELFESIDADSALREFARVAPDLLVLDMKMPGGGGDVVLKMLAMGHSACPVLVITGGMQESANEIRARLGIARVLLKPFGMSDFQSAVRATLAPQAKQAPLAS